MHSMASDGSAAATDDAIASGNLSPASTITMPPASVSATWSDASSAVSAATAPSVLEEDPLLRPIHRVASEQILPQQSELSRITTAVRIPSTSMGKITSRRRQRNPRRFVVTELPLDQDGFLSDPTSPRLAITDANNTNNTNINNNPTTSANSDSSNDSTSLSVAPTVGVGVGANSLVPTPINTNTNTNVRVYRPAKTEVRGRFTIIDLSPDSLDVSSQPEDASTVVEPVDFSRATRAPGSSLTFPTRRRPPPRRFSRTDKLAANANGTNANASDPTVPSADSGAFTPSSSFSSSHQHQQHSPHRVDLSGLDRHLVFLQQESQDMKTLLESMISINARWISALADANTNSANTNVGSAKNPKAVHPATSPTLHMRSSPYVGGTTGVSTPRSTPVSVSVPVSVSAPAEPTLEQKYDRLETRYSELEAKYDALLRESAQLQRNNIMLDTRLRQEMSLNEELRAHVDQLTQYTESLILGAEAPPTPNHRDSDPPPPRSKQKVLAVVKKKKKTQRTVSDVSLDSSAWTSNQSGLDDAEDEEEEDEDDRSVLANGSSSDDARNKIANYRGRRRLRHASLDDSSSSVYSSSYRDSWVSLFDPSLQTAPSDWRSHSYDASEASGLEDDTAENLLFAKSTDVTNNNQLDADDERLERRRKLSTMMIMEDLEDPAEPTAQK